MFMRLIHKSHVCRLMSFLCPLNKISMEKSDLYISLLFPPDFQVLWCVNSFLDVSWLAQQLRDKTLGPDANNPNSNIWMFSNGSNKKNNFFFKYHKLLFKTHIIIHSLKSDTFLFIMCNGNLTLNNSPYKFH